MKRMLKKKKKDTMTTTTKLPLVAFFNWDTKVYNPSIICSHAEPEKILSPVLENNSLCLFQNEPVPKE